VENAGRYLGGRIQRSAELSGSDAQLARDCSKALLQWCTEQNDSYATIDTINQKIISHLVKTRGDIPGVLHLIEQKAQLIQNIEQKRQSVEPVVHLWQNKKREQSFAPFSEQIDDALSYLEKTIISFLETEKQISRFVKPKNHGS